MQKLLIISFDAVGDDEFERLMEYPNFSCLAERSRVNRRARTVFLSNTYPIHASVVTGVVPRKHGVISNTEAFPRKHPKWLSEEKGLLVKTIWQAAAEKGMRVAAVLWPVTAGSKSIRYNIPEVLPMPGKSQVLTSLKAGSKLLQIKMFLRHRHLMKGIQQPELDAFSTACMVDILKEKKPELSLMHLTCYDTLCHIYGKGAKELEKARKSLDENLGKLLKAAGPYTSVILFTDHSQINIHTTVEPNELLRKMGLLKKEAVEWIAGEKQCFFECCGGSAFFHKGLLTKEEVSKVREAAAKEEWFHRFLTEEEMEECGHQGECFGMGALAGYSLDAFVSEEKGNHGYTLDLDGEKGTSREGYQVFYMICGKECEPGTTEGGSLLEIAPAAAKILGLTL